MKDEYAFRKEQVEAEIIRRMKEATACDAERRNYCDGPNPFACNRCWTRFLENFDSYESLYQDTLRNMVSDKLNMELNRQIQELNEQYIEEERDPEEDMNFVFTLLETGVIVPVCIGTPEVIGRNVILSTEDTEGYFVQYLLKRHANRRLEEE